ncbi:MAG TPA: hypothetical protein VK914_06285 [bacterium]|jgi:hypothetical protein|nr:hypothetical protein [bacterium]
MQKKSGVFSLCAVLFLAASAHAACDINTYAGDGVPGSGGDGGPATSAQLQQPTGVAADGSGNLYIADHGNNRIQKVSPAGIISTLAGTGAYGFSGDNGPAGAATFANPQGLRSDLAGDVYVADTFNNRIRKISTAGIITTVAGDGAYSSSGDNGPATAAGVNGPYAVALDPTGSNLYIAETLGNRIRKVDLITGIITTVAGTGSGGFSGDGGPAVSAELSGPRGVLVDLSGNIFIADTFNNRIREVSAGTINTVAGTGALGYSGDEGAALLATLRVPQGLAEDASGGIFLADTGNNVIRRFTVNGTIATVAGGGYTLGDGGPAVGAGFNGPWDCTLDSSGNLYIADTYDYRVRIVTDCFTGIVLTASSTSTQSPSPTSTATATQTPLITATSTATKTPAITASATATSTATPLTSTPTVSQTAASATVTGTSTPQTMTSTMTGTNTPTGSATGTSSATGSPSPTASVSSTPTGTDTATSSLTPSPTSTGTSSATASPTGTQTAASATATGTNTPQTATFSATATNTALNTATATSSATPTHSLSDGPSTTPTLSPTATPMAALAPPALLGSATTASGSNYSGDVSMNVSAAAGNDTLLLVNIELTAGSNVTSMTYDGLSLTRAIQSAGEYGSDMETWYLVDPPAGPHNLVFPDSTGAYSVAAMTFNGVNQTTPIGATVSSGTSSCNSSYTSTVPGLSAGNLLADFLTMGASPPISYSGESQEYYNSSYSPQPDFGADVPTSEGTNMLPYSFGYCPSGTFNQTVELLAVGHSSDASRAVSCPLCSLPGSPVKTPSPSSATVPGRLVAVPNPVSRELTLLWDQNQQGGAMIAIYNLSGRQIWPSHGAYTLFGLSAGPQSLSIDSSSWPDGVYIARLFMPGSAPEFTKIGKI